MNLVFLHRLEKKTEEDRVKQATVAIGETNGVWKLFWNEPDDSGNPEEQVWFEGDGWEDMLSVYRLHIAEKMGDGFRPLMEDEGWADADAMYRNKLAPVLECYSQTQFDESLNIALRGWRRERSAQEEKAPYLIASNRQLRLVATFIPHTEAELQQLPGWGEMKVGKYGQDVLAITKDFTRQHDFPLEWVRDKVSQENFMKWLFRQRGEKYRQQLEQQKVRKHIAEMVRAGCALDEMQTTLGVSRRELLLQLEELTANGFELGAWIEKASSDIPEDEARNAERWFAEIGDRYLKPVMMKMYDEEEQKQADLDKLYERLRILRLRYRVHSLKTAL